MFKIINRLILKSLFLIFLLIVLFLFFTNKTNAATLSISPSSSNVSVGNIISVKVFVNTENKSINNAEAAIQFPVNMLEVVSITKTSSIFSLWVEEPSFSNNIGKITFNGGVPSPGFNGKSGYIATITLKAKKQGTASIIFTDGAVRENDGLGTDILTSKNGSIIQIGVPSKIEVPATVNEKSVVPSKPVVVSDTHPNQDLWYSSKTASFSWKIPSGVTSVRTLLNKTSNSIPTINYDNSVTQKTLSNLSDGIYYFHLRFLNLTGGSSIAHYKIKIDSTPPLSFTPIIRNNGYRNIIKLNAKDTTSGIDYYSIIMDTGLIIRINVNELINDEYLLPVQKEGIHYIFITAYDKAGNHTEVNLTFLSPKILPPKLLLSSKEIIIGEAITITGKTDYPNEQIEITLQSRKEKFLYTAIALKSSNNNIKKYTQKISSDGTFSIMTDEIKTTGIANIWAEVLFSDGTRSQSSEIEYLKVNNTKIIRATLFVLYPLLSIIAAVASLMIFFFLLYLGWHKFFGLKKKFENKTKQTVVEVHKAVLLLKDELNVQLKSLEKVKIDRNLNKKEEAIFNEIKKNIEGVNTFIEKKLKNLI